MTSRLASWTRSATFSAAPVQAVPLVVSVDFLVAREAQEVPVVPAVLPADSVAFSVAREVPAVLPVASADFSAAREVLARVSLQPDRSKH